MVSKLYKTERGFTIMELTLALSFIAFLLIFIVLATMQTTKLYNKGLTLKSINQASRTIVEQMSRDITASAAPRIYTDSVKNSGILCTDSAVYLWNTIYSNPNPASKGNIYNAPNAAQPLYLVRTADLTKCSPSGGNTTVTYPSAASTTSELLNSQTGITSLTLTPIVTGVYQLDISLGTTDLNGYETPGVCDSGRIGEFCVSAKFSRIIYARAAS